MLSPTRQCDDGAATRRRLDIELVAEPLGAAEPQSEAVPRGKAVAQRLGDVGDARPLVGEDQPQAAPDAGAQAVETQIAAAAIVDRIARDLAGGGHDLGLVDEA